MMWAVRQLSSPLRYLTISQGSGLFTSKRTYDFVIPAVIGIGVSAFIVTNGVKVGMFTERGLVADVISLLNLLIAFFIAALAAVATFHRDGLDDPLKGEPAILRRRNKRNVPVEHVLSHRQFVCYLFGYLSFSAIILLLGLYGVRMFGEQTQLLIQNIRILQTIAKPLGIFAFFFLLSQLMVTMLLGIYFLSDRLQFMDDPTV